MLNSKDIVDSLRRELEDTQLRLIEAERTLSAIHNGEVDGLVVAGPNGEQVFLLQDTQEPYRLLIEQMSEGAMTLSQEGVILYANPAFASMLQRPLGAIIGVAFCDILIPADQTIFTDLITTALTGSSRGEVSIRTTDSTEVTLRLGLSLLQLGAGTFVCAVASNITAEKKEESNKRSVLEALVAERTKSLAKSRIAALNMMEDAVVARQKGELANQMLTQEITERKRAEEELSKKTSMFEALIQNLPIGVYMLEVPSGRPLLANEASFQLIGRGIMPEANSRSLTNVYNLYKSDSNEPYPNDELPIVVAMSGVSKKVDDITVLKPDGTKTLLEGFGIPVRDKNGTIWASLSCFQDITERNRLQAIEKKQNEILEKLVRERTVQLEAANKELEAFAYSVSHDLRAPLRGIDGWSLALSEDYRDKLDEQAITYIDRVRNEAQRMGQLIDDMLKLSLLSRAWMKPQSVDLSAMAGTIAERLQTFYVTRKFILQIQPGLTAHGDYHLLEIALTNLFENAFKFTEGVAVAKIEFGQESVDGVPAFYVRDNGAGFDMAYASKLFGAFQRMHTQAEFAGTGIGLATVQRVINRHGGRVWVDAKPGMGAIFYFTLGGLV